MEYSTLIHQLLYSDTMPFNDWSWRVWSLRKAGHIVLASIILGLVYPVFGDGFESVVPFINGFSIGLLGGLCISLMELYLAPILRKKIAFMGMLYLKILLYTLLLAVCVFGVILISRSIQQGKSISQMFHSEGFKHFLYQEDFVIILIYALVFVTMVIFTLEMSLKMGQGVLANFVSGKYFRPKLELRVFMFLDLNSSVTSAERLGDLAYHKLLNDFVHDITPGILAARGKIHQYVGDEVVISWPFRKNTTADHCLLAFLYSFHLIRARKDYYQARYGFVPSFKTAMHCGEVICGEIGEVKSEIVFHGDTINTTARMEKLCTELGEILLISEQLMSSLTEATRQQFRPSGTVKLRGKNSTMEVYRLLPGTLMSSTGTTYSFSLKR